MGTGQCPWPPEHGGAQSPVPQGFPFHTHTAVSPPACTCFQGTSHINTGLHHAVSCGQASTNRKHCPILALARHESCNNKQNRFPNAGPAEYAYTNARTHTHPGNTHQHIRTHAPT
eukprot:scaffold43873_cov19-Tisochrysis_lutea.AAC.1